MYSVKIAPSNKRFGWIFFCVHVKIWTNCRHILSNEQGNLYNCTDYIIQVKNYVDLEKRENEPALTIGGCVTTEIESLGVGRVGEREVNPKMRRCLVCRSTTPRGGPTPRWCGSRSGSRWPTGSTRKWRKSWIRTVTCPISCRLCIRSVTYYLEGREVCIGKLLMARSRLYHRWFSQPHTKYLKLYFFFSVLF